MQSREFPRFEIRPVETYTINGRAGDKRGYESGGSLAAILHQRPHRIANRSLRADASQLKGEGTAA